MEESRKVYLIDLDGTLLKPIPALFLLANIFFLFINFFPVYGFRVFSKLNLAMKRMLANSNPSISNYVILLQALSESKKDIEAPLSTFYHRDFPRLSFLTRPVPGAFEGLQRLKEKGCKIYLATNPIWPEFCVLMRLQWAGVPAELFDGITHSQNWHSCKPNIRYYEEILKTWDLKGEDCILIGDSRRKEGPAFRLGIQVHILRPWNYKDFWNNLGFGI